VTSGSWLILMQEKQRRQNVSYFILDAFTSLAKPMRELRKWTGWTRNRNAALRLHPLRRPVNGTAIASILLIHRVTLILLLKSIVLCVCLTALLPYLMPSRVLNRKRRPFGGRRRIMKCPALFL